MYDDPDPHPVISLSDPKLRWLISACVASLPGSFLAYSKLGGGTNSFLSALLPLIVLSIVGIAAAWERHPRISSRLRAPTRSRG
jgi:hypothetical protein